MIESSFPFLLGRAQQTPPCVRGRGQARARGEARSGEEQGVHLDQ